MPKTGVTRKKTYIIGAGGQARQVAAIYEEKFPNSKIDGFLDIVEHGENYKINGVRVLHQRILNKMDTGEATLYNGLGRPNRWKVISPLVDRGFNFPNLIHKRTFIPKRVELGQGTIVQAGVQFMTDVTVGDFVLIDLNATIGHDVRISDYTTITPGVNISGRVYIGSKSWIGVGAVILEGISVGDNCIIGAGSLVNRDIPPNTLAYGVPVRVIKEIEDAGNYLANR